MTLETAAEQFNEVYWRNKADGNKLKALQADLFEAFDRALEGTVSTKLIKVDTTDVDSIYSLVETYYPGFRVKEILEKDGKVIIEEDPSLLKYTSPPINGWVFGRTIVQGGSRLDEDALKQDHLEIYEKITGWPEPWWSLVRGAIDTYGVLMTEDEDRGKVLDDCTAEFLEANGLQRAFIGTDALTKEEEKVFMQYLVPGPVSVKLVPPRKAKPEEL